MHRAPSKPPPGQNRLSLRLIRGRSRYDVFFRSRQGTLRGFFDEIGDGLRLRYIHVVATFDLDNHRASAFGHSPLSVRRDHFVFGRDQVPTWLCSPCRLGDRTTERIETPRDLRVGHERSHVWTHVRGECGWELRLIEE